MKKLYEKEEQQIISFLTNKQTARSLKVYAAQQDKRPSDIIREYIESLVSA